jgi:hypothetical protein
MRFNIYKNLGRGLAIALLVLGSLSAIAYHDNAIAASENGGDKGGGKGNDKGGSKGNDKGNDKGDDKGDDKGGDKGDDNDGDKDGDKDDENGDENGGSASHSKTGDIPDTDLYFPVSQESYQKWLSDLLKE